MNVILLTGFIGLVLVGLAIAFFMYLSRSSEESGPERDSLLPLEDENVVLHDASRSKSN